MSKTKIQIVKEVIMLKKIIALFSRTAPEKPYTPPVTVRCYQLQLPLSWPDKR